MLDSVTDRYAPPPASASASAIVNQQAPLSLFADSDGLEKLLPAESARRFANLRSSLRGAKTWSGFRRIEVQQESLDCAALALRAATRYYERNVLAWYALGRVAEARSAREAITRYQPLLGPQTANSGASERRSRLSAKCLSGGEADRDA